LRELENSALGIQSLMILITIVTAFCAVAVTFLKRKTLRSFGDSLSTKVITKSVPFWWLMLLYYIIQGFTAQLDDLAVIGLGFVFSIPPVFYLSRVMVFHIDNKKHLTTRFFTILTSVASIISFAIWYFDLNYMHFFDLSNTMFTSYTLPISIAGSIPFLEVIIILNKDKTLSHKTRPYFLYFVSGLGILSLFHFTLARANPLHTNYGYGIAFFLFCCILMSIVDAFYFEIRGDSQKQKHFSTLELLTISHDQGKKVKNALYILNEYYSKAKEESSVANDSTYILEAIEILKNVNSNYLKIENRTRNNISQMNDFQDKVTLNLIQEELTREYQHRADTKKINLVFKTNSFNSDEMFFLVNKECLVDSILCNLLDNSIKFSSPGQSVVVKIDINSSNHLEVSVIDSCGGIDMDKVRNASKFLKSESREGTMKESGLGRGLVSAFYHSHLIGGELNFELTEDGTKTKITLNNSPLFNPSMYDHFQ
jgi:hypothetical protein